MGLLDGYFDKEDNKPKGLLQTVFSDPDTASNLAFAASMLQAGGPSTRPISFGQAFGGSYLDAMNVYNSLSKNKRKEALEDLEIQQTLLKTKKTQDLQDFIKQRLAGGGSLSPEESAASYTALSQGAQNGSIGPTVGNAARMDAILPPNQRRAGGDFPFSLNDVTMLQAMGGPNLVDAYRLATDPVKMEGGSVYRDRGTGQERYIPKVGEGMTLGANGVSVAPGYINSVGAIKGAESRAQEEAKANFDLLPLGYVGQDGRPIGGTRAGYINSLGQQSGPAFPPSHGPAPRPGAPTAAPAGFPSVSPEVQRGRDSEAYQIIKAEYDAEPNPQNRARLERELVRLQRAGAGSPPVLQSEAERQGQVGAVTGRQQTQQKLNDNWITSSYNPIIEAGRTASSMNASLDAIKTIDLKTGWGTEAKAHAASVLTSLGVAPQNAKLFAANAEKFQSVTMDRLLTSLQAQKGPQTEGDSTRAQQTYLQLKNTPEANQFIADFARAKANADARRARFYQEALPLAQQSGDLNEVDRRWAKIQGSIWSDPILQRYVRGK